MKRAVIFRCFDQKPMTIELYNTLERESPYDVIVICDTTNIEEFDYSLMPSAFTFTNDDLIANEYPNMDVESYHGTTGWDNMPKASANAYMSCEQPILMWWKSVGESAGYEEIWSIESDVAFTGHWSEFFETFVKDKSDLLATQYISVKTDPNFLFDGYWNMLHFAVPEDLKLSAFGQIHRYSKVFLNSLYSLESKSMGGYYELIVGTCAKIYGLSIGWININERMSELEPIPSKFTLRETNAYYHYYFHPSIFNCEQDLLQRLVTSPTKFENQLFHPIKDLKLWKTYLKKLAHLN